MRMLYSYKQVQQLTLLAADDRYRHWNEAYSVLLAVEGKGELSINGDKAIIQPGSVFFCNADRVLELKSAPHEDLVLYVVSFHIMQPEHAPGEPLAYREHRAPWLSDGELSVSSSYRLSVVMKELKSMDEEQSQNTELAREMLLYELLQLIQEQEELTAANPVQSSDHDQSTHAIQAVISHMLHHYREELTRDAMAQLAGFHPRFFSKIFKDETGSSFSEYLAAIRIGKAKEQLLLSDNNLDQIASNVGYSNGLYLSRKFKQITGVSPKSYIQKPKRVVIYDWVGNLLALGVRPVGASYFYSLELLHLLKDELVDVVDVGRTSIEAVIGLEPELIIVPKWLGSAMIGQLQKVAPTLIVPYGNPFERFRHLAHTLDKRKEAELFVSRYKQRAAEVKEAISGIVLPGETVGLYELAPNSIWAFNEFHGRGGYNLYRGIGLTPPLMVQQHVIGKGMIRELAMEQLPSYAADHMIISYPFTTESAEYVNRLMQHEVWNSIAAFQHNRVYFIDRRVFHPNDVYSLFKQLELQRQLFISHGRDDSRPCIFVHETSDL
ncbi:helix-turn-helix domain-containing protein [Paenibacillus eucommiae]|uniref:Iron complex transport system substrate-binding protein n=1 Tax=Paenibacillus eucommiae TaxID=1355755 RepID=A0ABS4ISL0_9BACL|nr:helix-turn-helix domain-containing protein [Paenibacillus eucommiae]MBP1990508.1 iron complex transport system substrate-binding protein [Paenibacillus eucommiae]